MSGTPLSNEQRAALEQRLSQLRAAQHEQREHHSAAGYQTTGDSSSNTNTTHLTRQNDPTSSEQTRQPYPSQVDGGGNASGCPAPQMGYFYVDDDEEEEEDQFDIGRQQFEEEFLRMLGAQHQVQQPQELQRLPIAQHEHNTASIEYISATRHANDGVDVVATDKTAPRSRELGDFEALRLVKMGDATSMLDFGAACGLDWRTFVDNHGRNALHYAADAGSASLIRRLADDLRVPYVADEKQLTPLDVAVLNGHRDVETDEVFAALVAAATAARHTDAALADPKAQQKTLESVLQAHAPAPPKFVMSKPVPRPAEGAAVRSFWSPSTGSAGVAVPSSVQCSSGAEMSADDAFAVTAALNALDQHGRLEWLLPVARGSLAPCQRWQIARTFSSGDGVATGATSTTGIVVAQVLTNATLEGPAAQKIKRVGDAPVKVVVAAHLSVKGTARRTGVAASLLHALRTRLRNETGHSASNTVVFFASAAPLPRPPAPLATVKWYRRVFDAASVYATDSAYNVFPDFYNYDTVLRADAVLKGAIPESLLTKYAADLQFWCSVDSASEEQCSLVLNFIITKAGSPESNVDLACAPQDVAELRCSYLDHPDHRSYVRTDAQGTVTDLVVFRRRDARKQMDVDVFAAEVVFALFTSVTGTVKVDHMMLMASKLLSAKMLLLPTLFGITESDLAKSNFDEVVASRESVYGVSLSTLKDVEDLGAIPAAKLSLPLYCI